MKRKLLFAMLCIVSVLGLKAQTWTASEVAAGNFVIYNVGSGQFLTAGNAWGTQASITTTGVSGATQVELIANSGNWFIRTGVGNSNYGLENLAAAGDVYMDQSRNKQSTWTFTQVGTDNGPVYNIISAANHGGGSGAYLTANSGNTVVSDNGTSDSDYAKWKLLDAAKVPLLSLLDEYAAVRSTIVAWTTSPSITDESGATATFNTALSAADTKANNATTTDAINEAIADLKAAGNTFLENVIITAGINITNAWITNPTPTANGNGWTLSGSPSFDSGNNNAEYWSASGASIKQTLVNLPKGAYKLTAIALTRTGMVAKLSAGSASMNIATVDKGTVNNRTQANTWFNAGNGINELDFTLDEAAASLVIGLTADNTTSDYWMVWRSFSLTYYGDPINLAKSALAEAVAAAEALEGTIPSGVYTSLAAVVTENNKTYSTVDEYNDAVDAIVTATNNAKPLQTSYSRYTTIKTAALAIASGLDTSDEDAAVAAATTADAINAAVVTLRAAFLAELPNVEIPNDPGYIDVTSVMVDNASVRQSTNFWTIYNYQGYPNTSYSNGVVNYEETEFYQQQFKFYQTLALTPGTWEFGVTGFHRAGNHSTYFYAGDDRILIPGVASNVVNTMAQAKTYFDGGNGKVSLKFLIETAGNVEIGINNQDTETDRWTIFRDFTLKYYGAPDYTVYENQWADLVTEANTAKTTHTAVTGTELTALNEAIADSPAGSNLKATYNAKITALQNALGTFNAAAPSYNSWVLAKNNTTALWGSALGVADPTTAAEAAAGVNALNVAQYNKVADDYTYSMTFKIGDFSTWDKTAKYTDGEGEHDDTPQTNKDQHWSATTHEYYEQGSHGWGASNGFNCTYEKTANLPAGNYVLKVAARASGAVTGSISTDLNANTVALPSVGASSKGIDKSGAANFGDGEFANEGIGFGWEWRFLPFTLESEGSVTITINESTSATNNWFSLADAELFSDADKAVSVELDEYGDFVTPISDNDGELANVTLTRRIKEGFNTVCLPFDMTADQVEDLFGTDSKVYAFSDEGDDADHVTVNFETVGAGTITANTPVLVKATKATDESESNVINGVIIKYSAEPKVEGTYFDFVGTYEAGDVAAGDYYIGGGKLYKSAGTTEIWPSRAYLKAKAAVEVKMFIDDMETSINSIMDVPAANAPIYTLAGQRVSKAVKGLYIVNGKKVVIK